MLDKVVEWNGRKRIDPEEKFEVLNSDLLWVGNNLILFVEVSSSKADNDIYPEHEQDNEFDHIDRFL